MAETPYSEYDSTNYQQQSQRYAAPQVPYRAQAQQPYQPTYEQPHQQTYDRPGQQAQTGAHSGNTVVVKKGGGAKSFFLSFFGALIACALAFGGFTAWQNMQPSKVSAEDEARAFTLGTQQNQGTTTINATGEDIHLPEAVAAKALPSVVCINVYAHQTGYYGSWGMGRDSGSNELVATSLGSGIILTSDGYILTNYHVVEGGEAYKVNIAGEEYDAELVGSDPSSDLAVIKADAAGLTAAEIGDSDNLIVGEWVMTIGAPFGLEQSVATGVVSATSRSQVMDSTSSNDPYDYLFGNGGGESSPTLYPNLIQTDAAINPGNSGGALVDAEGKVIGVNTLITSYSGNYSGVGFAIPINYANSIAQQIIAGKTPSHAKLGVSLVTVTSSVAKRYDLKETYGAYVQQVGEGTGASAAGIEKGDIIIAIEGTKMESATDVTLAVREHNPGDTVTVTVNRDGETKDVRVKLGSDQEEANVPSMFGMSLQDS